MSIFDEVGQNTAPRGAENGDLHAHELLYRLGVTENHVGFYQAVCAIRLCTDDPERLLLVTRLVYPEVARQYRTTWKAVERNLRTVGSVIWAQNRPLLEALARRPLAQKPYSAELLSILSHSLRPSSRRIEANRTGKG